MKSEVKRLKVERDEWEELWEGKEELLTERKRLKARIDGAVKGWWALCDAGAVNILIVDMVRGSNNIEPKQNATPEEARKRFESEYPVHPKQPIYPVLILRDEKEKS